MDNLKVKVIKLNSGSTFLVINDTAGKPHYCYDNIPVYHPEGYIYFPPRHYGETDYTGKLFKLVEIEVKIEEVPECVPAKEKYSEYEQLKTECDRLQYGRYEQHPSLVKKEDISTE